MRKVKIHATLVKDGYIIILKYKNLKPQGMTDAQFDEKDEIAKVDILLALDDKVLFNDKSLIQQQVVGIGWLRRQLYNLKMKDETSIDEHQYSS